ncbi:MAG: hypothetical protein ACTSSM_15635 [Promethearchaeota archaeon]
MEAVEKAIATSILLAFGFVQGAPTQSASALLGIKLLMFVAPAIMHGISLIFIYLYPYYGEKLKELNQAIIELHAKKKKMYEERMRK